MMGNEMGNNNTSGLRDEENTTIGEVGEKPLAETTRANEIQEENGIVNADEGTDFHEKVTNLPSNGPERKRDPSVDDQILDRTEQEATEVQPVDESSNIALESNKTGEEDGEMQANILLKGSAYEKPIAQTEKSDLQGTIKHQLEKQASFKKENMTIYLNEKKGNKKPHHSTYMLYTATEEEGTMCTSHDPEPKESTHLELNHHEMATVHADDQTVEDGSGRLEVGSEDSLGSNPDFEVNGHLSDAEALEIMVESVDSNTDPIKEKQRDDLLLEQKASQEQFESSEEKSETRDGGKVECGLSTTITTIASDGGKVESHEEFSTEMDLIGNYCSELEQEAIRAPKSANSNTEAPEPEEKCMIVEEEIRLIEKELENGENNHDGNTIQSCGEPVIESDSFKSTEPQSEAAMIVSILESGEKVCVFNPLSSKDCRTEETKAAEKDNLVVMMCVENQSEASEDHFLELEEKIEVVPELGMVPLELTVAPCNDEEKEATEKTTAEENGNNTEPSCAIAVDHDQAEALPLQRTNDSILNSKQENCSEFFATKASTVDFNNWIAEALVSMNKLALDIPDQHVTQRTEPSQAAAEAEAETKIPASQSNEQCEKVETSESVSCDFETQENVGRSSTESDVDNLNVRARMQKSPSFSLDLQNEARTEESDSPPLPYHDKAAIEGSTSQGDYVTLGSCIEYTGYEQGVSQYQAMPVEEKVITLETSNSEKSNTSFLGFLKEEEEARIVVTPQEDDNRSTAEDSTKNLLESHTKKAARDPTTSSKGKAKRRQRSSLFTNCMCCATVIN